MSAANGMVVLPHDSGDVQQGDLVELWPFDGLI
jgi:molybdopterin biosynthesis enzyme